MLISIIITTYNSPDYLRVCLNSFTHQTDKNFEIIIADDGSTKETKDAIKEYNNNNFKIFHAWHEDQGFRAAKIRNEAVKLSSGEYLIFVDGDCIAFKDFVKNHRSLSEKGYFSRGNRVMTSENFTKEIINKDININSICFANFIKLRIQKKINRLIPFFRINKYPFRKILKKKWKGAKTCNLGVWRNDFKNINGYDENYIGWGREDSDFVIRLINSGVYRKEATFSTGLLHLNHKINSRENFSKNDKLLHEAISMKKKFIKNGYRK